MSLKTISDIPPIMIVRGGSDEIIHLNIMYSDSLF
jgi:hypothetical protein